MHFSSFWNLSLATSWAYCASHIFLAPLMKMQTKQVELFSPRITNQQISTLQTPRWPILKRVSMTRVLVTVDDFQRDFRHILEHAVGWLKKSVNELARQKRSTLKTMPGKNCFTTHSATLRKKRHKNAFIMCERKKAGIKLTDVVATLSRVIPPWPY